MPTRQQEEFVSQNANLWMRGFIKHYALKNCSEFDFDIIHNNYMNLLNTPQKARTKVKATTAVMRQKEHKGSHMTRPERAPSQVRAAPSVRVKPHLDGAPDQPVLELLVVRQRQARTPQPMVPRPRRPLMRKSTRSMKHFLDS